MFALNPPFDYRRVPEKIDLIENLRQRLSAVRLAMVRVQLHPVVVWYHSTVASIMRSFRREVDALLMRQCEVVLLGWLFYLVVVILLTMRTFTRTLE